MLPHEIDEHVRTDIRAMAEHAENVEKLMVTPSLETFDSIDGDDLQLWIIGRKEEYYLTLDAVSGRYGLAFRNIADILVHLGDEGSIASAYETLIAREDESGGSVSPRKYNNRKKRRSRASR